MLSESDFRFDQQLADWFFRRGLAWSGTASELLASLRSSTDAAGSSAPQSSNGLYVHLQSHQQILRSLGVDVSLHSGVPRMVSLRECREEPQRKPPTNSFRKIEATIDPSSRVVGRESSSSDAMKELASIEALSRDLPVPQTDLARKSATDRFSRANGPNEGFFLDTGEALFAMVEMRRQIREQGLDLEATVDLVVSKAQEFTQAQGVAVGFLPEEVGWHFRSGMTPSREQPDFDANLFQSSLVSGEAVQVPDAQAHPLLGARCRREGIGSLIMVPIFRHREVAGAIEFFFQEKRSFSPGDLMDLGLIAGIVSESLGGSRAKGVKRSIGPQGENAARQPAGSLLKKEENPGADSQRAVTGTIHPAEQLSSPTPEPMVPNSSAAKSAMVPDQLWLRFKRAWKRQPGRM